MNIEALAADIASRVPSMALDNPINNAELIKGLILDELRPRLKPDPSCSLTRAPFPGDLRFTTADFLKLAEREKEIGAALQARSSMEEATHAKNNRGLGHAD